MKTISDQLGKIFYEAASPLGVENIVDLKQATNEKFGHYQYNSAMRFGKTLGKPPRAVAEEIAERVREKNDPLIASLEVAGPGFINITLNAETVASLIEETLKDDRLGIPKVAPKRVVIDFSSPNTAKEMHVGHLRSTIIGDTIARTLEFLGHDVLRLNHIGDWGTAFGMLIAYLKETHSAVLTGEEKTDLTHLVRWYKESKFKFDNDADFKKKAQLEVVALQGGDPVALKAWEIICRISSEAYQEIYDLLGIRIQERGESFYNPFLADVVEDLTQKGLVEVSEGAKCIFLEGFTIPVIVQKSDGGYNYATTDLASIRHRLNTEKGEWLIYVTDAGQAQHFEMVFKTAEKAGYLDRSKTRVDHVPFGLVLGPDGKKYKTRSGDTEKLIDLIDEAIQKAETLIREKNPDYPDAEVKTIAKALGIGAIKYADLSTNRTGDYVFSYDKMLRFEGNTAAYLLYSYVRVNGVKRKSQEEAKGHIRLEHPSEIALGVQLLQFGEALEKASEELLPNRLTDYLYTLAEKFHAFYRDCRIEGTPERLLLSEAVARTMKKGLDLLGVQTVERM